MGARRESAGNKPSLFENRLSGQMGRVFFNLGLIFFGSLIYAVGLQAIIIPHGLLSGGLVGVSLIIQYLVPALPVGGIYFVLNIPLLVVGWFNVSRRFMIFSIAGMVLFSAAAEMMSWIPPIDVDDPILAALAAGVICGVGSGLILRSLGSAGGLDVLAVYMNKRFGLRLGTFISAANTLVLSTGALVHGLEIALYSIIFVYTTGRVMDAFIAGFNRRKMVYIISGRSRDIADHIMSHIQRGVTFINGRGAYSGTEKEVILTITSMTELPRLKEDIFSIDPEAFVIVNDTLEVLGKRHGKLKVY